MKDVETGLRYMMERVKEDREYFGVELLSLRNYVSGLNGGELIGEKEEIIQRIDACLTVVTK